MYHDGREGRLLCVGINTTHEVHPTSRRGIPLRPGSPTVSRSGVPLAPKRRSRTECGPTSVTGSWKDKRVPTFVRIILPPVPHCIGAVVLVETPGHGDPDREADDDLSGRVVI